MTVTYRTAFTTMNKKPTRCTIVIKSLKYYYILIPLYMFRALTTSDRTKLEDTTNPTTRGDWRLYVQNWEAPDDGRKSARNI
jgi:hypothetical protein